MEVNIIIGNSLKEVRQEEKLTLGELAGITGVSKGMLSQIEEGTANPIMSTIWKINSGLNVPYMYLLEDDYIKKNPVVRKAKTVVQHSGDHPYRISNYYSDNQERNSELLQFELDSGKKYQAVGHSKCSIEYIMVVQRTLILEVGDQRYLLPKDTAMHFDANQVHTYINEGTEQAQAIIIDYYA